MKKMSFLLAALGFSFGLFADTVTVREPGLVEGLVVGSAGVVTGLVGMTKDLLVGRTVTYTVPAGAPALPPCAAATPAPVIYVQPTVIPSVPPVVVTPAIQPVVALQQPVVVTPCQTTLLYLPYRGWGPPPLRPRHDYHPCPPPYPGPYCRAPLW